ncbi:MAG: GatB/YqeY domain-containing protein [Bacteroidales bacterium]|nr:GatB/YqeY domain-containing protein [Bacteroidales bacterium]
MSLAEIINEDMKSAMRERNQRKLEALRAIKAGLLLLKTGKDISSGEIPAELELQLLQKLVKQREESAAIYRQQDRADLAEEEEFQAGVIKAYLPKQMSEEEIRDYLKNLIARLGVTDAKGIGKVMGAAAKELAGQADNRIVSAVLKDLLS